MNAEDIKKMEDERKHLQEWLENYNSAKVVAPIAQQRVEILDWQISAFRNAPPEAAEIVSPILSINNDDAYRQSVAAFPMMPHYSGMSAVNSSAGSAASTSATFQFVARVGDIGTPESIEYSHRYRGLYQTIQQSQDRPGQARDLIGHLGNPQTVTRFDTAHQAFREYKIGSSRTGAANDIRTLLLGINGDLLNKARLRPNENPPNWETMAVRLAPSAISEFKKQEAVYKSLLTRCTEVQKDRKEGSLTNLGDIWTETLEHIYALLTLVVSSE